MKVKIKQPTSLKDIKLSQYQKFLKTTKDSEDEQFIARQIVGIFCNIPDDLVGKIAKRDFNTLVNDITAVLKQDGVFTPIVKVNGVEYGFIPKLDDITVDEQGSIDNMVNDMLKMDKVMSVLYRPVTMHKGDTYLIEPFKELGSLDLDMQTVQGALVFFCDLLSDCLNCIQSYIKEEVKADKKLQSLVANGVGINQFINSLEVTFSNLQKLVSYDYMKH